MSTAKQRKANIQAVADFLAMYGAFKGPGLDWTLDTPHGLLSVALWSDKDANNIFMRWEKAKPPAIAWEANQYSGKWNIHEATAAEALAELHRRLERVGCTRSATA